VGAVPDLRPEKEEEGEIRFVTVIVAVLEALLLPLFDWRESDPKEEKSPVGVEGVERLEGSLPKAVSLMPPPTRSGTRLDFRFEGGETIIPAVVLLLSRVSGKPSSSVIARAIITSRSAPMSFIDRLLDTLEYFFSSSKSYEPNGDVGTAEEAISRSVFVADLSFLSFFFSLFSGAAAAVAALGSDLSTLSFFLDGVPRLFRRSFFSLASTCFFAALASCSCRNIFVLSLMAALCALDSPLCRDGALEVGEEVVGATEALLE